MNLAISPYERHRHNRLDEVIEKQTNPLSAKPKPAVSYPGEKLKPLS